MLPIAGTMVLYMSYKTVLFSASKTMSLIHTILTPTIINYDAFQTALVEYDVKKKVAKIHKLLLHFNINNELPFIKMAIDDICEAIQSINECIEQYKISKEKHDLKCFNTYRTFDNSVYVKTLTLHIHLLNTRFDDLIKIIQVMNGLQPMKPIITPIITN
jgi:hypothetical protein